MRIVMQAGKASQAIEPLISNSDVGVDSKSRRFRAGLHSTSTLTKDDILTLFTEAERLRKLGSCEELKGKLLATLFFELSTRTKIGMEAAMLRMGGALLPVDLNNTRLQNQESLEDTIQAIGCATDILAIRHAEPGISKKLSYSTFTPIINCGDGTNEHPTQALLDLYTVWREFGRIDGLQFAFVNDVRFARSVHSILLALNQFDVGINIMAPTNRQLSDEFIDRMENHPVSSDTVNLSGCDVIYVHPSPERWVPQAVYADLEEYCDPMVIDSSMIESAPARAILLHPGSRGAEVSDKMAKLPRSRIYDQNLNGIFIRMALLKFILNN